MTPRSLLAVALFGLAVSLPAAAGAQEINLAGLGDGRVNHVHLRTGAEHGFVAGVGYGRALPFFDRHLLLYGDLTVPWAGLDFSDYQVRIGALVPIVGRGRWKLAGSLAPTLRGTESTSGRMTNVGLDFGLVGGFYARRWFVAGEFGFDWAISTYLANSDYYRRYGYANARDGWYAPAGGVIRYGAQAGVSLGRFDVVLRAGQPRDVKGKAFMLPAYATLGADMRW